MNDLINIIDSNLLAIILPIIGIGVYIFALAATGSYPFRDKFRWNDLMSIPFEEDTPPRKKLFRDNTDRILLRCRARKIRCKHWPVVENPKWVKNIPKYDAKTGKYINTKYSEPKEITDTSDLYEIEPYTGNKRKIKLNSHLNTLVTLPYDKWVLDIAENEMIFFVVPELFKINNIQIGQRVKVESDLIIRGFANDENINPTCEVIVDSLNVVDGYCILKQYIPKPTVHKGKKYPYIRPTSLLDKWDSVLRVGPPLDVTY